MSAIKKLASQTAIYGLSSIIGRIAVWGLTPILTAKMEVAEYGIFNDLYAFVTYFLVILTFGMETAFFRYSGADKTDDKPYTQSIMFVTGLALLFVLLFSLSGPVIAGTLGYGDRPILVMMVVWITFFDVVSSLPMAKLRQDERPIVFAALSLFNIFVTVALNLFFIFVLKETSAEYVFLANLIATIAKFGLLLLVSMPIMKRLEGKGKILSKFAGIKLLPTTWKIDPVLMRSMAGFGLYIMIAGLFGMINQNADGNFITRIWGKEPAEYNGMLLTGAAMNGIYSANKKLAVFILLVTQAFRYAAEPFFFRHASQNKGRVVYAKVFHYFMLASLFAFLMISSFSYEFVSTKIFGFQLIDQKYWKGLNAVAPLMLSAVVWGAYTNLTIWYKLTKQVRFGILFSGLGVILMVGLFAFMIPAWGYLGAAYAMLITYTLMTALVYLSGQKYYYIPYKMGRIGLHAVIYLGCYLINANIGDGPIFTLPFYKKLVACILAIALSYAIEKLRPIRWVEPKLPETDKPSTELQAQ
jgi:O-antigen/teichoic acid export membrane protein